MSLDHKTATEKHYSSLQNTMEQDILLTCKYHYERLGQDRVDILRKVLGVHVGQHLTNVNVISCLLSRFFGQGGVFQGSHLWHRILLDLADDSTTCLRAAAPRELGREIIDRLMGEIAQLKMIEDGKELYPRLMAKPDPNILEYLQITEPQ